MTIIDIGFGAGVIGVSGIMLIVWIMLARGIDRITLHGGAVRSELSTERWWHKLERFRKRGK